MIPDRYQEECTAWVQKHRHRFDDRMRFDHVEAVLQVTCPSCGRQTRWTTAGCDHCDLEDK